MEKLRAIAVLLINWVLLTCGVVAQEVPTQKISLAFVGDVMLARGVGRKILNYGNDYPFAKVKDILSKADIAFANLEGALTGKQVSGSSKVYIFCSPPSFGESLVKGGIDIVSLANNHAHDGGVKGLLETMGTLDKLGIKYVGAGRNSLEARSLRIIEVGGKRIGFLAYTDLSNIGLAVASATSSRPGVASARTEQVFEDIRQAKREVDLLVVSFHWGVEGQVGEPNSRQKSLAYRSVEEGADIIVGHHPHVLQKIEVYRDKTIAYSLGNFVFDSHSSPATRTMILWIDWFPQTGEQKITQIPCYIRSFRPEPVKF